MSRIPVIWNNPLSFRSYYRRGNSVTDYYSMAAAIAGIDLQHILGRLPRCVGRAGISYAGLHGRDVHDDEVTRDEYHVERDQGVFHPKALRLFFPEDEEHAAVLIKMSPVHQALRLISWFRDNLHNNPVIT